MDSCNVLREPPKKEEHNKERRSIKYLFDDYNLTWHTNFFFFFFFIFNSIHAHPFLFYGTWTPAFWGCHTKAVSFAMFWESCVCLFFNTHHSGNQCFIYVGNELGNYIRSYLTFPSLLFQGVKKVHYKKCFKPLHVAGHQHFIVPLILTGLFSFLLVEKFR